MTDIIQYIALKGPIEGEPKESDFEFTQMAVPELESGQFLTENIYVATDPGARSRLSKAVGYAPPIKAGEMVTGFVIGRVLMSKNSDFSQGDLVMMGGGWSTHSIYSGKSIALKLPDIEAPISAFIGVLGIPGMTSYFGLKRVGRIKEGDHVLISSAAGPVGATAGQLARQWGAASVTGTAGSTEKCKWLTEVAGFDAALNYKAEDDLGKAIAKACPDGVDILFDNVGNKMIDTMIPLMRPFGRIIISGQVADYNTPLEDRYGIKNTATFIASRLSMEGILVFDDMAQFPTAQQEIAAMINTGALCYREEIFEGLEALPKAFCGLFKGESSGRRLVKLRPEQ